MNKYFTKCERVFMLASLFIVNVLCLIKFFIGFVKQANFINWLEKHEEITASGNLDFLKVTLIISVIIVILLLLTSLMLLLIKNKSLRGNFIIAIVTFSVMVICFYFIGQFISGEYFSIKTVTDEISEGSQILEYGYLNNALYLIVSLIITFLMTCLSHSISTDMYSEREENNENNHISIEEESILEEIKNLKAKIRIKDLEKEYLNLKAKLDDN